MPIDQPWVIIDVETTGASASHDRIIEIGLLRVEAGEVVRTYQTLIDPQTPISPFITGITGIRAEDVAAAPVFADVADEIFNILSGCVFVAHNARFDYGFVRSEFRRLGIAFSARVLCTVRLSRLLFPQHQRHNLDALIQRHALVCRQRHRALGDAEAVWAFLQLLQRTQPGEMARAAAQIMKRVSLPPHLPADTVRRLPAGPGVYVFFGEDGGTLYVGKSVNIKNRVLSHFTDSLSSAKELKLHSQVRDIEAISTVSELGALFVEAHLVQTLQPAYNRQLRRVRKLVYLKRTLDAEGFERPVAEMLETLTPDSIPDVLGVFKSVSQAKGYLATLAKEYKLCEKKLGLDASRAACFGYHLGRCQGACVGEESPAAYNARFAAAFARHRLRAWPYDGPVAIREADGQEAAEVFIFDQWCFLGAVRYEGETEQRFLDGGYIFDYEAYKILRRWLSRRGNKKKISRLAPAEVQALLQQAIVA